VVAEVDGGTLVSQLLRPPVEAGSGHGLVGFVLGDLSVVALFDGAAVRVVDGSGSGSRAL
jgi:hypothetical protein